MAEPLRQVEVQLGHLCNNRCVFCVSGQLSEQKRAPQLPADPIRVQLTAARAAGATKITFLGGEPTMQASFFDLLQHAVDLDFDEIVLFTNGTMTPRESFRDRVQRVLDGLGPRVRERVIWRFSLQGGTREAHDATTVNPGAWDRIQASLQALHAPRNGEATGARLTGNLCVVASNYASIVPLADIAAQFDFENLHLDMVRPRDSGDRTDAHLRQIMSRYTDMAPYFAALSAAVDARLGPGFDLNFGNVPYCTAPDIRHRIHHDGQATVTVAADGQGNTQDGFDKYLDKRSDKHKPAGCATCVFDPVCSGVFDKYREFHGDAEFVPVAAADLWPRDTGGHHFVLLAAQVVARLQADGRLRVLRTDERAGEVDVAVPVPAGPKTPAGIPAWTLTLRRAGRPGGRSGWFTARAGWFEAVLHGARPVGPEALRALREAVTAFASAIGDPGLTAEAWTGLDAAWHEETRRKSDVARGTAAARRQVAALATALQQGPLAGLRPLGLTRAADGEGIDLRFGDGDGVLLLHVTAGTGLQGHARPQFRHEAQGLDAARVAAFSQALGQRLRALSGPAPLRP